MYLLLILTKNKQHKCWKDNVANSENSGFAEVDVPLTGNCNVPLPLVVWGFLFIFKFISIIYFVVSCGSFFLFRLLKYGGPIPCVVCVCFTVTFLSKVVSSMTNKR